MLEGPQPTTAPPLLLPTEPEWYHGEEVYPICGTPVRAAHAGTAVIETDQAWAGKWLVKVSTGEGSLTTWYPHMQQVDVQNGQTVQTGQQIGEVGARGV